jgi:hypothetical protein
VLVGELVGLHLAGSFVLLTELFELVDPFPELPF